MKYRAKAMTTKTMDMIPMEQLEEAVEVLRILAHPHRLAICELLLNQRISVGEIAEQLNLPSNAVSQHLNGMRAYGLVKRHREGKTVYYQIVDPRPSWLLECIRRYPPEKSGKI